MTLDDLLGHTSFIEISASLNIDMLEKFLIDYKR